MIVQAGKDLGVEIERELFIDGIDRLNRERRLDLDFIENRDVLEPQRLHQATENPLPTEYQDHMLRLSKSAVFFTHPHSPWERGSNENLNRIVREYLPKGIEITSDPTYLTAITAEINNRPRKIHSWKNPSEIFTELLEADASTA